jgi:hypothetical protein
MRFRRLWLIRNGFWKWWYDRDMPRWQRWLLIVVGVAIGVVLGLHVLVGLR